MEKNNYPCELPRDVVSLTRTKIKPHRPSWILLAARDTECDIVVVYVDPSGEVVVTGDEPGIPYSRLWETLGQEAWSRVSNWTLTFRGSYVLRQTKWLAALERGDIELERQRKLAGKQAGRGSVAITHDMTDLDLRVGGKKIKLLDWNNFGVDPGEYVKSLNDLTAENCLQIFTDWIKTQTKVGLSASRTSAPQIGWAKLRQSLGDTNIYTSLDPEIRALERRCYYGGRCEPFRLGVVEERCYLLDVRAAYASICATHTVPVMPLRYWPQGVDVNATDEIGEASVAADVIVRTGKPWLPCRHGGKVIYPTGRFFTSLCGIEFEAALTVGAIEKICRAVSYVGVTALADYADWYMASRDKVGANGLAKIAGSVKAAFNSSLGFFARQGREWCTWDPAGSPPWWFGRTTDPDDHSQVVGAHALDGECELLRVGSEPRNCAPIVHASICAGARANLYVLINFAGKNNVVYCDTDGLIVTQAGYDNLLAQPLVCGPEYGQLSVRAKAASCTINGQKNYKIGDKIVCAGLPADRHKDWKKRDVLETATGKVDAEGRVFPYTLDVEDVDHNASSYQNVLR